MELQQFFFFFLAILLTVVALNLTKYYHLYLLMTFYFLLDYRSKEIFMQHHGQSLERLANGRCCAAVPQGSAFVAFSVRRTCAIP